MQPRPEPTRIKARTWTIRYRREEGECERCGAPMLIGDRVHHAEQDEYEYYCSRACLKAAYK